MLIRRPVGEVFEAFADPAVTSRFWFSRGSGRLKPGAEVRWDWDMYGVGTDVAVREVEPGRRILMVWDNRSDPTEVDWRFEARGDHTWVTIENRGFSGTLEKQTAKALDSTGGFALVLAGAKVWLEHGINPRFVPDRHPDHHAPGWKDDA
nr:SRPBCC family protein [Brevundimonas lenta]